jgi:hypothetical protein
VTHAHTHAHTWTHTHSIVLLCPRRHAVHCLRPALHCPDNALYVLLVQWTLRSYYSMYRS